jgi:hypothetical protein
MGTVRLLQILVSADACNFPGCLYRLIYPKEELAEPSDSSAGAMDADKRLYRMLPKRIPSFPASDRDRALLSWPDIAVSLFNRQEDPIHS